MSFEDAVIGNGDDFDPRVANESLIRAVTPDLPPDAPMDVRALNTRLGRKIGQQAADRAMPKPSSAPLDFSADSVDAPVQNGETNTTLDFSDQSVDPPAYDQPQPPKAPGTGVLGAAKDVGLGLVKGVNTAAQDVLELTGRIPVVGDKLVQGLDAVNAYLHPDTKSTADRLKKAGERLNSLQSPEQQAAGQKKWWDEDKGSFGDAWGDWRSYSGGLVESLPEQSLTMLPGLGLAKWAYKSSIAAGVAVDVAAKRAARAALLSGSLSEGALGGAQSARQTRDKVNELTPEILGQSDAYKALLETGLTPDAARTALAEDLSTRAFVTSGVVTGLFGGMGDRAIVKIFTDQVGKSAIRRALGGFGKGALAEGLFEELPQSIGQQLAENEAVQKANPSQRLMEDVVNQGLGGAVIGALQGGGMGAVSGAAGGHAPQPAATAPQPAATAPQPNPPTPPGATQPPITPNPPTPSGQPGPTQFPPQPDSTGASPSAPSVAGLDPAEYATLREYGYEDEDIANMSPAQRASETSDALTEGLDQKAAIDKFPLPATEPEKVDETSTGPLQEGNTRTGDENQPSGALPGTDKTDKTPSKTTPTFEQDLLTMGERLIREHGKASTSYIQRRLGLGYNDAATLMEQLEKAGVVGPMDQNGKREILPPKTESAKPGESVSGASTSPTENERGPGTRAAPIVAETAEDVQAAQAAEPTPAQATAGNYQHSHMEMPHLGLEGKHSISVETGQGQVRTSKDLDEDGTPKWQVQMDHAAYGNIKGTVGADGSPLDIFIGPHPTSPHVFVIDQVNADGSGFDEHKVLVGFRTPIDALHAYANSYTDHGKDRIGGVTAFTADQFKDWLENGDHTQALKKEPTSTEAEADQVDHSLTEAGTTPVPKGPPSESMGATTTNETQGNPVQQPEDLSTSQTSHGTGNVPSVGDRTDTHVDLIESALGPDADTVAQVDIARAAEIMAENEGMEPATAFGQAVIETSVEQGLFTQEQAEAFYGEEVNAILDAGREGASGSSSTTEQGSAQPDEVGTSGAAQTGKPESSSEAGKGEGTVATEATGTGKSGAATGGDSTTGRSEPTGGKRAAGDKAKDTTEHQPTAKDADNAGGKTRGLRSRILDATYAAAGNRWNARSKISDIHKLLPDVSLADLHKEMKQMQRDEVAILMPLDTYRDRTKADEAAELRIGGEPRHILWVQRDPRVSESDAVAEPVVDEEKKRLEDVGEKIGGARKDRWNKAGLTEADLEGMTGGEKDTNVTKHNVWPKPDWAAAVEGGVEPVAAALMKRMYDRIAVKPTVYGTAADASKKTFISVLKAVREAFDSVKTVDDAKAVSRKVSDVLGKESYGQLYVIRQKDARYSPLHIAGADVRVAEKAVADGWPNMEPWKRLFEISERTLGGWHTIGGERVYVHSNDRDYVVYRKNGGRVGEPHPTKEAAEAAAKAAYEELGKGGTREQEPTRPHLDQINRDGPDYRKDRDVTGDDFTKDFGFRGVEFGNWAKDDERQKMANLAYDALHDLARVLNLPAMAMSLDGTLAIGFGSRGKGGKGAGAAHYEADRTVINMTKIHGAGSLAHEWMHALDHYLGEFGKDNAYGGAAKFASGGQPTPQDVTRAWKGRYSGSLSTDQQFRAVNGNLTPALQVAFNRLMHDLFNKEQNDTEHEKEIAKRLENAKSGQQSWIEAANSARRNGGRGLKKAEQQIRIWGNSIKAIEEQTADGTIRRKIVKTDYLEEATKLSGKTGDYWRRPLELLARAFESFVFDKIREEGFTSQYLAQGVEGDRFGTSTFRGNPYPTGDERKTFNEGFERIIRALTTGAGKKGNFRIEGKEGEPEPIVTRTPVKRPTPQPNPVDEIKAVEKASNATLADAFAQHFASGGTFAGILEARKFAKEAGFAEDAKTVEEAIEFGVVKTARDLVAVGADPSHTFQVLVDLYNRQPKLGTRTSTSVRDQAYSTPVPLAYVASQLAHITKDALVYEPTAGNGALLIAAGTNAYANEINPERAKNLREQGFFVGTNDASEPWAGKQHSYDVVIANPPFGAVRTEGVSKVFDMSAIQPGYQTHEIDHAIALRQLEAMKDDGRAVLILGGVNKQSTGEARRDAYRSKAKREFFKTLYDRYVVADHFTVNGDLYERQGAAWPVDVIVINGRGKSSRALPGVDVPPIYDSWPELGGLVNGVGQQNPGNAGQVGERAGGNAGEKPGLAGNGVTGGGDTGRGGNRSGAGGRQSEGVEPQPVSTSGNGRSGENSVPNEPETGERREPGPVDNTAAPERPSSGLEDDLDALISGAINDAYPDEVDPQQAKLEDLLKRRGKDMPVTQRGGIEKQIDEIKKRKRTTPQVAKDAATSAVSGADAAFSGLYQLFGGGKTIGSMPSFDNDTYAKAKPFFKEAATMFRDSWDNTGELIRRMVTHMRDTLKFAKEAMEAMAPYLKQFILDLKSGAVKLGEQAAAALPKRDRAAETEGQVRNTPRSKVPDLDTLVPANLKVSQDNSLDALEARVGPVDHFVASELGFTPEQLANAFGAEQVDALGLAIDNIKRGAGFIIGDQTGIGKGRVNAAMIRWAMLNDRIPIFVTMTPGLYADIYRDMKNIGMTSGKPLRILATDSQLDLQLDEDGTRLKNGDSQKHSQLLASVADPEAFKAKYDIVVTTYSQMQTVGGGEETTRRAFLRAITPHSTAIFDESHNAGGQGATKKPGDTKSRSGFAREIVQRANGVFYSSATYAKRPDVMDLYAATNMAMAVDDIQDLAEAIARGGVPMQQAVATMLAEDGQYIRRERSFAGIDYNTPLVAVDRENYDKISGGLADIQAFSKVVKDVVRGINDDLAAEGARAGHDGAIGGAGAESTNFTSVMHNLINQMLLAMKSGPAAKMAIEAIKRGEKPVLTVANTMESFLNDYMDTVGLKVGDEMPADFADVLKKYLDRTRTITVRKPFMKKGEKAERHYLTDEELGERGVAAYQHALELINAMDLSSLPVSPIDALKGELQKAGYSIGEITGRQTTVDYTGKGDPVITARPGVDLTPRGKNATLKKFNTKPENGGYHALIINQSGSTGLSAHASVDFNDQSVRHMIIVQPEGNIDTHMQLLGRVNRTGQVVLPIYSQLVADIPAEKRPAAVLAKKMASLNANTTASRDSAVTAKDVPDFMNEYGDQIAAAFITENLDLNPRLATPIKFTESGRAIIPDAMRKLTGRIPLLPLVEQDRVYDELEHAYSEMMAQLTAAGHNPMEAKTYDLKAKTIETTEVQGKKNDSGSRFAAPVIVEKVSVVRLGKPFTPAQVVQKVLDEIGVEPPLSEKDLYWKALRAVGTLYGQKQPAIDDVIADPVKALGEQKARQLKEYMAGHRRAEAEQAALITSQRLDEKSAITMLSKVLESIGDVYSGRGKRVAEKEKIEREDAVKDFSAYVKPILEAIEDVDKKDKERTKLNAVKDRWTAIHQLVLPGTRVTLKTVDGNLTGIITGVKHQGHSKNPLALSSWKAEFAIADSSRHMILPFSRIQFDGKSDPDNSLDVEVVPLQHWIESAQQTLERYAHMQSDAREERFIATGNLLAAYDWLNKRGNIIGYTTDKGAIRQGILTARSFKLEEHAIEKGKVLSDPQEIKAWIDNNPTETIWAKGQTVNIRKQSNWSDDYLISADKSKKTGGIFFLDKDLIQAIGKEFVSRSGRMLTDLKGSRLIPAIARMQELGAVFTVKTAAPKATKVVEEPPPPAALANADTRAAEPIRMDPAKRAKLEAALMAAMRHMLGDHVAITFSEGRMQISEATKARWGDVAGDQASGVYYPYRHLIQLALVEGVDSVAFHEAYHAVEYQLQTPIERDFMQRETPAIRQWIAKRRGYSAKEAASLADVEVRAIGAEEFLAEKGENAGEGLHIGVRRWYRKLKDMLRRLANAMRGLGFNTYSDIYGALYRGDYANRQSITPRREADRSLPEKFEEDLGSVARPGGPPVVDSMTIAEHLETRNWNMLASVSKALKFGDIRGTELRTRLQDRFIRVRRAQESIGRPVPTSQNAYQAESLFYGRGGRKLEELKRRAFDPLIEHMKQLKVSVEELDDYLYAQHAPERNAAMSAINPAIGPDGSGMTDAEAAQILSNIATAGRTADFAALEARVRQITDDTRNQLVRDGLISQALADAWADQYDYYVPLRGFETSFDEDEITGRGQGYDTRAKESQHAYGRRTKADGPLPYVMMQAQMGIVRGEKNRVGNAWLRFVRSNPDPRRWTVDTPPMKRTIDATTGLVVERPDHNWAADKGAFITKVGGHIKVIRMKGADGQNLARALKNLGSENLGHFLRFVRGFTTTLSRLSTQWNPNFIFPNLVRDLGEAYINLQAQQQRQFIKNFSKHIIPAIKGSYRGISGSTATDRYTTAFREFDAAGGRIHFFGIDNPVDIEHSIDKQLKRLDQGAIRGGLRHFVEGFETVNGAMENATRLAAYMAARDVGMSQPDAAMLARNLTVDFNKRGELGGAMNALWMFSNVAFQGARRTVDALQSKAVRRAAYSLVALGAMSAMLGIMGGGDDDSGESYYSRLPFWTRDKNLIIMWPGGKGKYVSVPLPFLFGAFKVLGDRLAGVAMGIDKPSDALSAVLRAVVDGLNPLGEENATSLMALPSVLRPVGHIETNINWTGKPLYPTNQWDKSKPASEQSFNSNSEFSKTLARGLNAATGGSRYKSGAIDWHPGSIDHVFETLTGGLGKFFSDVKTTAVNAVHGEFDPNKTPIVRRFVGSVDTPQADAASYYDRREEARKNGVGSIKNARKDLGKGANKEEAEAFLADNTTSMRGEAIFKNADAAIKPLRDRKARIEAMGDTTEPVKADLADIVQRIRDIQNRARLQYRELKAQ